MSDVKKYDCTNGRAQFCYGCYQMTESEYGDYVEVADYDALQAERNQLRAQVEEQLPRLIDENHKLRAELDAIKGQEPVTEVSAETFSSDGTSDIITANLPIGTKLYALPPQQPDAVSVLREACDVPLYEAIELACGGLPDGWTVEVGAERGGAWVTLYNAAMEEVDFPSDHERLDYTVNDAIEFALLSTRQAEEGE